MPALFSAFNNNSEIASVTGGNVLNPGTYNYQGTGSDAGQLQHIGTSYYYAFDADGNRTCVGTGSLPCTTNKKYTYTYDGADRPTSWSDTTSDHDYFTYDGNGQLTDTRYTFPAGGGGCPNIPTPGVARKPQHVSPDRVRPALLTCSFEDKLTWNTALGGVPTLAVDHEYATGVDEGYVDYIMGPQGLPLEQIDNAGTVSWYYQDFQGSTRALYGSSGSPGVQNYPPFGVVTNRENGGSLNTPLQYAGGFTDGWTGLVYDEARWYDTDTGQFLSQDPMVHADTAAVCVRGR